MNISKKVFSFLLAVFMTVSLVACSLAVEVDKSPADLVVYGKIFTSEGNQIVEAFAVKDGKYIYVGDKKGAEAFIEKGKTEVLDYTGKGLVMPGCGNGHAHYMLGYALKTIGTTIAYEDDAKKFMNEILPAAVKKARDTGASAVFGQGWNLMSFGDHIPTRQELDAVCSDLPMYFLDDECHKALTNTCMLVKAGIMKEDGTVLKSEIRGGEIQTDAKGVPTGFLSEQAQTYVRSFLDDIYTLDMSIANVAEIEQHMLSEGYTMYMEGWGNYFVNMNYYKALQQLDKAGKLHFVAGLPFEIESWMNVDEELAKAADAKKFASKRVIPNWIKLLMDGTVESGTGFVEPLYPDGHQGIANWTEEEITDLTRKANEKGLTMHIHALGNKAVNCVVNAFINGGKDEIRNTLVHVRNVNEKDYRRIADHNIYVSSGVTWHHGPAGMVDYLREHKATPIGQEDKSYPFKSFFDNNIPVSIHSDYPALSGSPDDPFGIMEIAVTGVLHSEKGAAWWPEELATREQALTAMTIGCARQMFIEDERGSIKAGKYADFLLVDKDVLTCPVTEIHSAKPEATYFEGKRVFSNSAATPIDYSNKNNWMKQPKITKNVDTIYIYPTEYDDNSAGAPIFADINEEAMREPAKLTYLMQGTVYEDSTNVFVPFYRQVNMAAASKMSRKELDAAFNSIPKTDVFAALAYYFEYLNDGRPFILAGHSQGSAIQSIVLSEYMKAHPEYLERMIAAYVIGYSITEDYLKANPHLKFAEKAYDTNVIISWNTEGSANDGKENMVVLPNAISINPLNWKRDETYASEAENLGGYIYNEETGKLEIVPHAADAQLNLKRGVVITTTKTLAPVSYTTVFGPASYHEDDYALYYNNIKANVSTRIAAYQNSIKQKAPDYSKKESWYKIPAITKDVDTFYINSTAYILGSLNEDSPEYATIDNAEMLQGFEEEYMSHATVYEDCTNVFMPLYRQAGMRVMKKSWQETGDVDAAISRLPYKDITAALDYYFENCNGGRPFIIAGHSQGSAITRLVLKKYFKEHPEYYERMIAAYAIGYSITQDDLKSFPHLKFATGENDTGVIVSWNTEGKENIEGNIKTAVLLPNAISINPLNWKLDETYAPASENLGSLVDNKETGEPEIADIGADAQIVLSRGTIVTNAKPDPMPEEVAQLTTEYFGPGARHDNDYTFYYNNIKDNVAKRIAAYKKLNKK